ILLRRPGLFSFAPLAWDPGELGVSLIAPGAIENLTTLNPYRQGPKPHLTAVTLGRSRSLRTRASDGVQSRTVPLYCKRLAQLSRVYRAPLLRLSKEKVIPSIYRRSTGLRLQATLAERPRPPESFWPSGLGCCATQVGV